MREALVWRHVLSVSSPGVAEESLKVRHRDRAGDQVAQALDSDGVQIGGDFQDVGKAADRGNGSFEVASQPRAAALLENS